MLNEMEELEEEHEAFESPPLPAPKSGRGDGESRLGRRARGRSDQLRLQDAEGNHSDDDGFESEGHSSRSGRPSRGNELSRPVGSSADASALALRKEEQGIGVNAGAASESSARSSWTLEGPQSAEEVRSHYMRERGTKEDREDFVRTSCEEFRAERPSFRN